MTRGWKEGKPVVVTLKDANATCSNMDFMKPAELQITTSGSIATLGINFSIINDIPENAICATEFYKKEEDMCKELVFELAAENCCKFLFDNSMYKKIMESNNTPKQCPITKGEYSISNYSIDTSDLSDKIDRGDFCVKFSMRLPSGKCLYGMTTEYEVRDKD
ncbi:uncharacterized protein [Periplaneta americana]|uniref:uncharacterized protein isoform X2 n=1 Tax=Periplaneta americana TaxID=6978 RepID=UPI0037E9AF2D